MFLISSGFFSKRCCIPFLWIQLASPVSAPNLFSYAPLCGARAGTWQATVINLFCWRNSRGRRNIITAEFLNPPSAPLALTWEFTSVSSLLTPGRHQSQCPLDIYPVGSSGLLSRAILETLVPVTFVHLSHQQPVAKEGHQFYTSEGSGLVTVHN